MNSSVKMAYSYVRFSSKIQEWGDSERRQEAAAKTYCERKGLTLSDMSYADRGVSAKAGRNRSNGSAFSELLSIVKPGDYILIEDNDRFSREDPITALADLKQILNLKDITVVFLSTGVEATKRNFNEPSVLFPNFFKGYLGYSENQKKGERIAEAWATRQKEILDGKDRFGKLPFWLRRHKVTGEIEVIREAADVVKTIYRLCDEGKGIRGIVQYLNKTKTPLFRSNSKRGNWVSSTVQFVLRTPTVFGAFQNRKKDQNGKRQPVGGLVENILPVIVPKAKVQRVWDKISARPRISGRFDPNKVRNLFTGIAKCANCGGSMVYTRKGKHGYLTCADFHFSHTCKPGVINCSVIENILVRFMALAPSDYRSFLNSVQNSDTDTKIGGLRDLLSDTRTKMKRAVKLYTATEAQAAMDEVTELKREEKKRLDEIAYLEANDRTTKSAPEELRDLVKLLIAQSKDRVLVREKFRAIFKSVIVDAAGMTFSVHWNSSRVPDWFEVRQEFKGCRGAKWFWRFRPGEQRHWSAWSRIIKLPTDEDGKAYYMAGFIHAKRDADAEPFSSGIRETGLN
jgi:hypothetical protein